MPVPGTLSDFLTTPKEKWIQVPDDLFSEESDFHGKFFFFFLHRVQPRLEDNCHSLPAMVC